MAITGPTIVGGQFIHNVTSLSFSPSVNIPAGSVIFLAVATSSQQGVADNFPSDGAGNVYLQVGGTHTDTVAVMLFMVASSKLLRSNQSININFPSPCDAAAGAFFFTGANGVLTGSSSVFSTDTNPLVACPAVHAGDKLVGLIAVNGPASDGFTQDGNFSSDFGSGISTSAYSMHGGTRDALLAGTFSYAPVLGAAKPSVALLASFN